MLVSTKHQRESAIEEEKLFNPMVFIILKTLCKYCPVTHQPILPQEIFETSFPQNPNDI